MKRNSWQICLGGATLVERFEDLRQHIAGLSIDWLPVSERSRFAGKALGATEMRTRTGVSAIAVLRHGTAIPAPGPDEVLLGGDTVVVVGVAEGIDAARANCCGVRAVMLAPSPSAATLLVELGAILVGLGMLGRIAGRVGLPSIPLYLVVGLMVGEGGFVELVTARRVHRAGRGRSG